MNTKTKISLKRLKCRSYSQSQWVRKNFLAHKKIFIRSTEILGSRNKAKQLEQLY